MFMLSELIKCVLNIGTNVCAIDIFISQGLKARLEFLSLNPQNIKIVATNGLEYPRFR